MNQLLRAHAEQIVRESIAAVLPDEAVRRALRNVRLSGRVVMIAVGKAAWRMAKAASDSLGERLESGVIITKYGHVAGLIRNCACYEAGHPVPDENTLAATEAAIRAVSDLKSRDTVLFLLSGGGSALFEKPLIPLRELSDINRQLLNCGADIVEINTVRKRLSAVKGGKFALLCAPARIEAVILSDILGDPADMIASGPVCADSSTCRDALAVRSKYALQMSEEALRLLAAETPKSIENVQVQIAGSVRALCSAAAESARRIGYEPFILTDRLCCEAREAGSFLASVLKSHAGDKKALAFIAGGETVVRVTGDGLGGRNQELVLSAARQLSGIPNVALFSVGSDGTDGPTDAAGGYADGDTLNTLMENGLDPDEALRRNDACHALEKAGGLLITGPTGTNVNDVAVGLIAVQN